MVDTDYRDHPVLDDPFTSKTCSTEEFAERIVDLTLLWGSCASIVYWLILIIRLPVIYWYFFTIPLLAIGLYFYFRKKPIKRELFSSKITVILLLLSIFAGAINLLFNRPDSDDIAFSHRAFVDVNNLNLPFSLTNTLLEKPGLPPITPLHVFTSIEPTTSLIAKALHLPQLGTLHLGLGTLVNFILPIVLFLFIRLFRSSTSASIFGVAAALFFIVMSGDTHRDWGNFTIMRSWQGKAILMELIVPLSILFTLRFCLNGKRIDLVRVYATSACGFGLSGTGLFLIPFTIIISSVSVWITKRFDSISLKRVGIVAMVLVPMALIALLPFFGLLPKVGDISIYITSGWPRDPLENLAMVFTKSDIIIAAYFFIAIGLIKNAQFYSLVTYLATLSILLTVPLSSHILIDIVTPGAYWRFAYAFVTPILIGLTMSALYDYKLNNRTTRIRATLAILFLISITILFKKPTVGPKNFSPFSLKFNETVLQETYRIAQNLKRSSIVLAPESIVVPLSLLRPDLRFIAGRPSETELTFTRFGNPEEGKLRYKLSVAIAGCDISTIGMIVKSGKLPLNNNVIITPKLCPTPTIKNAMMLSNDWHEKKYTLYNVLYRAD